MCHDLFDVVRRKDLQTLQLTVFTHSLTCSGVSPITKVQGLLFHQVFQPHDLARRVTRTSSAFRDFGPGMLLDTIRGKDTQTIQMRALIRSLHLVTRSNHHQALGRISPWCFCRMILLTCAARTSLDSLGCARSSGPRSWLFFKTQQNFLMDCFQLLPQSCRFFFFTPTQFPKCGLNVFQVLVKVQVSSIPALHRLPAFCHQCSRTTLISVVTIDVFPKSAA